MLELYDHERTIFISIILLTYPTSVPTLFSVAAKMSRTDLLLARIFAGTNLGLSMINFAGLGLSDENANSFLR